MNLLRLKKKKGVSLLEVVISLAILAIISIPIGGILINSVKTSKATENKQQAALLGQEILEVVRVTDFSVTTGVGNDEVKLSDGIKLQEQRDESGQLIGYKTVNETKEVNGYDINVKLTKENDIGYVEKNIDDTAEGTIYIKKSLLFKKLDVSDGARTIILDLDKVIIEKTDTEIKISDGSIINELSIPRDATKEGIRLCFQETGYFSTLKIQVKNNTSETMSIYLDKTNIPDTDVDENTTLISVENTKGVISVYNNVVTKLSDDEKMGNVFKSEVEVFKNSKLLFEGNGIVNIVKE